MKISKIMGSVLLFLVSGANFRMTSSAVKIDATQKNMREAGTVTACKNCTGGGGDGL